MSPQLFDFDYNRAIICIIMFLAFPILPFMLIVCDFVAESEASYNWSNFNDAINKYKRARHHKAQFIRRELCIETSLQVTFSILLIVFSKSITRTQQGLEAIFDDSEDVFGVPAEVFIIGNMVWSIYNCWQAYVKGMSGGKCHFPMTSSLVLGLHVVTSIASKCSTTIIFLAPSLGLMNLLRHYQAERWPFWASAVHDAGESYEWNLEGYLHLPGKQPMRWSQLSRLNYTDPAQPTPPDNMLTSLYTYFSLETCLYAYWIIMLVQTILILIAKRLSNPVVFKRQSWLFVITNALESCNIPVILEDWDNQDTTIENYVKAQRKVEHEMGWNIVINSLVNAAMTTPMAILGKNFVILS